MSDRLVYGANLRFYPIRPRYLEEVRKFYAAQDVEIPVSERDLADFRQVYDNCRFTAVACEIMSRRMEDEKHQKIQTPQITRGH